jgi:hypothetical protein
MNDQIKSFTNLKENLGNEILGNFYSLLRNLLYQEIFGCSGVYIKASSRYGKEYFQELMDFEDEWKSDKQQDYVDLQDTCLNNFQRKGWDLFDKPHTSLAARVGFLHISLE